MAKILCIETSAFNCSVAVSDDGMPVAVREESSDHYTHAENLHLFIEDVLRQAGIVPAGLDAVAVSRGPGSYTGLRIGVSSAKGLCMALGVPLVSYTVTEVLAREMRRLHPGASCFVPMIDARRMEVYTATYDRNLAMTAPVRAEIIGETFFASFPQDAVFAGDGAMKAAVWKTGAQQVFSLLPSATMAAGLAHARLAAGQVEDVAYFEPFYLKDFVAGKPSA
jgi:tRNA threonylcarbamoyladenosine biosynthesis protein TsaB